MAILIDTGLFYAFYNKRDVHHMDSICIIVHALEGRWGRVLTTDLIVSETFTLLRRRIGINTASAFLKALKRSGVDIIFMDPRYFEETVKLIDKYKDVKLSFTDSFTVVVLKEREIEYLATYDEKNFLSFGVSIIGREYASTLSADEINRIKKQIEAYISGIG